MESKPMNQTLGQPVQDPNPPHLTTAPATVKTKLLILSDTHSSTYTNSDPFKKRNLPRVDVVLHCGDLTMIGEPEENLQAIELLRALDAELKLVIAGNHDLTLHEEWYLEKGKRFHGSLWSKELPKEVMAMRKGEAARKAGVTYLEEGIHDFKLSNGAQFTVYASPWQPWFGGWAFNYPLNHDRWNPPHLVEVGAQSTAEHPIPDFGGTDIVMTHGPPYLHLDKVLRGQRVGCPHLLAALKRSRPRLHCFGHIHEAWGAERVVWQSSEPSQLGEAEGEGAVFVDVSDESRRPLQWGKETLLVNASIMDVHYRRRQSPWVVDLELPKAEEAG